MGKRELCDGEGGERRGGGVWRVWIVEWKVGVERVGEEEF